jgi:FkbM family methyltransferase
MKNLFLYNFYEYSHIILNYLLYNIQLLVNKEIVKNKELNDGFIKAGFTVKRFKKTFFIENDKIKVLARKGSSDANVFQQIFIEDEYAPVIKTCKELNYQIDIILDCGSNIGLSSIYFKMHFPNTKICAIEPFEPNVKMLNENFLLNKIEATVINGAIWNKECYLGISREFRGGKEWAITMTDEAESCNIKSYTINQIAEQMKFNTIDLLKIDIEGGESYIFNESISDVSFLNKVKIIVMEIHDEFNCRENINYVLKKYGFDLSVSGELTIGIKKIKR